MTLSKRLPSIKNINESKEYKVGQEFTLKYALDTPDKILSDISDQENHIDKVKESLKKLEKDLPKIVKLIESLINSQPKEGSRYTILFNEINVRTSYDNGNVSFRIVNENNKYKIDDPFEETIKSSMLPFEVRIGKPSRNQWVVIIDCY
jgi:hypothetical protein